MSEDPAVKLSISMPASLHARMLERMKQLGIKKPSDYLQTLVHNDYVRKGPLVRLSEETTRNVVQEGEYEDDDDLRVAEEPPSRPARKTIPHSPPSKPSPKRARAEAGEGMKLIPFPSGDTGE